MGRQTTTGRPGVIGRVGAVIAAAAGSLLLLRRWRRTPAGAGRRPDDGGGPAGVREPRNPIPPTLVDAGAAEPD